jgi:hypothetical protein
MESHLHSPPGGLDGPDAGRDPVRSSSNRRRTAGREPPVPRFPRGSAGEADELSFSLAAAAGASSAPGRLGVPPGVGGLRAGATGARSAPHPHHVRSRRLARAPARASDLRGRRQPRPARGTKDARACWASCLTAPRLSTTRIARRSPMPHDRGLRQGSQRVRSTRSKARSIVRASISCSAPGSSARSTRFVESTRRSSP